MKGEWEIIANKDMDEESALDLQNIIAMSKNDYFHYDNSYFILWKSEVLWAKMIIYYE